MGWHPVLFPATRQGVCKNKKRRPPPNDVILHQILKLITPGLVGRIAGETGLDAKARTFSVPSHPGAMLFAQLTHPIGLNDVCD
jgi:hypothetical protein